MRRGFARLFAQVALLGIAGATTVPAQTPPANAPSPALVPDDTLPPPILREFRGVWVATVSNIDWPSRPGLPVATQKAELIALLDRAAQLKLNAVVFQVRPGADALYKSSIEPWSYFLTGQMGRPPEPFYDPLEMAVTEAHKRGLELHAWFNPYRARHPSDTSRVSRTHISRTNPSLVKKYGRYLWMDPGEALVRRRTVRVIVDVVKRYDIDGVHIDDYFYPYPERARRGGEVPFPDTPSWQKYRKTGGKLSRADWRRRNVDLLVEELNREIHKAKPWVKFGISPFGIWRPGYPETVRGLDAYTTLYADSRRWLHEGWLDYFTPQLYWKVEQTAQSYPVLLDWWVSQNERGRHIWAGNYTSRIGLGSAPWRSDEIIDQIRLTRNNAGSTGNVHFSMEIFLSNKDAIGDRLVTGPYAETALVPASPWMLPQATGLPIALLQRDTLARILHLSFAPAQGARKPRLWTIRAHRPSGWQTVIVDGGERTFMFTADTDGLLPDRVVVTSIDRVGNESALVWGREDVMADPAPTAPRR